MTVLVLSKQDHPYYRVERIEGDVEGYSPKSGDLMSMFDAANLVDQRGWHLRVEDVDSDR